MSKTQIITFPSKTRKEGKEGTFSEEAPSDVSESGTLLCVSTSKALPTHSDVLHMRSSKVNKTWRFKTSGTVQERLSVDFGGEATVRLHLWPLEDLLEPPTTAVNMSRVHRSHMWGCSGEGAAYVRRFNLNTPAKQAGIMLLHLLFIQLQYISQDIVLSLTASIPGRPAAIKPRTFIHDLSERATTIW